MLQIISIRKIDDHEVWMMVPVKLKNGIFGYHGDSRKRRHLSLWFYIGVGDRHRSVKVGRTDDLNDSVNYVEVFQIVKRSEGGYQALENWRGVINEVMEEFPQVEEIRDCMHRLGSPHSASWMMYPFTIKKISGWAVYQMLNSLKGILILSRWDLIWGSSGWEFSLDPSGRALNQDERLRVLESHPCKDQAEFDGMTVFLNAINWGSWTGNLKNWWNFCCRWKENHWRA